MWTQEKLEELYRKVNERAARDSGFYEKVVKNTRAAMEEMAGCEFPEDMGLQYIEKDANYGGDYVVPDFAEGEIDLAEMRSAAGGISNGSGECGVYKSQTAQKNNIAIALIVSICAVATQVGADIGACGAAGCLQDACVAQACAAKVCAEQVVCAAESCAAKYGVECDSFESIQDMCGNHGFTG